jgi:hypothetical protein
MSRELKAGFWTVVGAVVAALAAILSAFGIGFELGQSKSSVPTAIVNQICEKGAVIKLHALRGPNDQVARTVARLLTADGCTVDGPYQIQRRYRVAHAQIRYFHRPDGTTAMKIMQRVHEQARVDMYARYMSDWASRAPQGDLEIWFP